MPYKFDPHDRYSWYFGAISRDEANTILENEKEGGVFLVRDSNTIPGDLVLCVKEGTKTSHYIVNKICQNGKQMYKIGDQVFSDFPELLHFYQLHYLDTTFLIRPATKKVERVIAKYDFDGRDEEDLPFRRHEILTVVSKDEQQWWTVRNSEGRQGVIPVNYVHKYEGQYVNQSITQPPPSLPQSTRESAPVASSTRTFPSPHRPVTTPHPLPSPHLSSPTPNTSSPNTTTDSTNGNVSEKPRIPKLDRHLPSYARVKQARNPSAYDMTQLRLEVNDIIKVLSMNISGQWEGELNGRRGHFPFTHIEFIDDPDELADVRARFENTRNLSSPSLSPASASTVTTAASSLTTTTSPTSATASPRARAINSK